MSVKFILLISSLVCLNVQTSSSTDLPSAIEQVGQYHIFDIYRTFWEALMECHVRAMILIGLKDLDDNPQLWGALNSVQSKGANPEQFWVATKRSITDEDSLTKCFKVNIACASKLFSLLPTFEMSKPSDCMEKRRFVCKKPGSTIRSLIEGIKTNIHSAVSKSKRVVRWFKEKLKKIGEFTAGELTEIGEILIDTFKQTGSNIGSGVKGVTLWTKENMEALATKIAEDLHWSKDKAKDALNKILEVIDEETDELLKD